MRSSRNQTHVLSIRPVPVRPVLGVHHFRCRILGCVSTDRGTRISRMEIRRVRFSDPEVASLLDGLRDEYDTRYGENIEMTRASEVDFDPPAGLFIVLMDGATTAAGGGFRRFNETTCEVKRMWTHPLYRRRGLATRVLQSLEDAAREIGYAHLVLETGLGVMT